jgi:hypothetical protein
MVQDDRASDLRAAIEHRAAWFALLVDEAGKRGLDSEFARAAIKRCGYLHADERYEKNGDLNAFAEAFATENVLKIFDAEYSLNDDGFHITFHYCPLVVAWKKLGVPKEKQILFCDIAMEGDRGILEKHPEFCFDLEDGTIANGDDTCRVHVTRKRGG